MALLIFDTLFSNTLFCSYSDLALLADPEFKKCVEMYAKDEELFFKDFAAAFAKLLELGVPFAATKPWYKIW